MEIWAKNARIAAGAGLMLVLLLILGGCAGLQGDSAPKSSEPVKNGMRTAVVKNGDIGATFSGSGIFVPVKLTSLFFNDISGPLKKLYVKTNDRVKAGDAVAEVDQQVVRKEIAEQQLTVEIWQIRKLQNAENKDVSARNLELAKMSLEKAEQSYKLNPSEENSQELARQKILYEQAVSADKNAKWDKDIADIQYKINYNKLNDLKNKLAGCVLKAPADGIVTYVENLSETEMVNSGRVIVRLAEPKNIVLQMLAPDSRYLQNVKNGVLTIDSEKYAVELYSPQPGDLLSQTASDQNANNRIYVKFNEKMPDFDLGGIVNAKLEIEKSNVLLVPKAALRDVNGKTMVDVVKGNLVDPVEVVRGLEQDGNVEIISGLEAGQTVVLY